MEAGPRLLHGDLWVGNMAMDGKGNAVAFNPASWYGPGEFDLSVGVTFGMPERFFEAYHYHIPRAEGFDMRMKVYKLYHLLHRLNGAEGGATKRTVSGYSYRPDNFNGGKTLTTFRTNSVLNPIKHSVTPCNCCPNVGRCFLAAAALTITSFLAQYRSEMEMITKGLSESSEQYLKEVVELMKEIINEDPPKVRASFLGVAAWLPFLGVAAWLPRRGGVASKPFLGVAAWLLFIEICDVALFPLCIPSFPLFTEWLITLFFCPSRSCSLGRSSSSGEQRWRRILRQTLATSAKKGRAQGRSSARTNQASSHRG